MSGNSLEVLSTPSSFMPVTFTELLKLLSTRPGKQAFLLCGRKWDVLVAFQYLELVQMYQGTFAN